MSLSNLLTPSLAGNDQFLSQSRSAEKLQCWNWLWQGLSFSSASPLVRCLRTSWNRHDQHIALRVPSQLNLGHDRAIKPFGWRHRWLLQQQCRLHPRDCAIFFQQTESGILWLLIYRVLKKGLISGEDTRKVQCVCFQENLQETTYVFPCFAHKPGGQGSVPVDFPLSQPNEPCLVRFQAALAREKFFGGDRSSPFRRQVAWVTSRGWSSIDYCGLIGVNIVY